MNYCFDKCIFKMKILFLQCFSTYWKIAISDSSNFAFTPLQSHNINLWIKLMSCFFCVVCLKQICFIVRKSPLSFGNHTSSMVTGEQIHRYGSVSSSCLSYTMTLATFGPTSHRCGSGCTGSIVSPSNWTSQILSGTPCWLFGREAVPMSSAQVWHMLLALNQ